MKRRKVAGIELEFDPTVQKHRGFLVLNRQAPGSIAGGLVLLINLSFIYLRTLAL